MAKKRKRYEKPRTGHKILTGPEAITLAAYIRGELPDGVTVEVKPGRKCGQVQPYVVTILCRGRLSTVKTANQLPSIKQVVGVLLEG